jgi:O-antigen/teichoic acid export membrane protein
MQKPIFKVGSALVDQGAFSLANFLINIQLARLLPAEEYGLFALAFTIFTLVNIVLSSFLVEPMMIHGSGVYSTQLRSYLRFLIGDFWKVVVPVCALIIFIIGLLYRDSRVLVLVSVLALGVGPLCFQFVIRRICYLYRRPWVAAVGGLVYLGLIVLFTFVGGSYGSLNSLSGLGVMIVSAVFGTLAMMALLRSSSDSEDSVALVSFEKEVRARHLGYGRWAVLTAALSWIPGNIYILLLPVFRDYEEVGLLRAAFNLILPVIQIQLAMTPLLLPWLVRQIEKQDFIMNLRKMAGALIVLPVLWTLGLFFFGRTLLDFVYSGKYQASNQMLGLLGATTIVSAMILALSATIKAHSRPELLVRGYAIATVLCLLVGVPLMIYYGVQGVIVGMILAASANFIVLFFQFVRLTRSSAKAIQSHAV